MNNIKLLREKNGLTQKGLAQMLNITQQSIYKYEADIATPNIELLREMSHLFHTSIDFLLDHTPDSEELPDSLPGHMQVSLDEYQLLLAYRQLNEGTKRRFRAAAGRMS